MKYGFGSLGSAALVASGLMLSGNSNAYAGGDLGGSCCISLEERIAELEASTVRKGNRRVSLKISGHINKALMIWDDGVGDGTYIQDNETSRNRFKFNGSAAIAAGWTAGFVMSFEFGQADSALADQDSSQNGPDPIMVRKAAWYIKSQELGQLTVGHYSLATDNVILLNYGGTAAAATSDTRAWNGGFIIRGSNSNTRWDHVLSGGLGLDSERADVVRYDSPTVNGFMLSAAWGDQDLWDVALKWKGAFGHFRLVAGVGYLSNDNVSLTIDGATRSVDYSEIKGSTSLVHVPTGVFMTGAYLDRERDIDGGGNLSDSRMYYLQAGIKKRVLALGATTLFTEYSNHEDFGTGIDFNNDKERDYHSSNVDVWGIGIVQRVDRAGMEVYAVYRNYDGDLETNLNAGDEEDFRSVAIGARIKF